MKYEVLFLPIAGRDVLGISDALSAHPDKAKRLLGEIESKLKLLEFMPQMWPKFPPSPDHRRMDLEDHLLLYTVDESARLAIVYRVLSDKADAQANIHPHLELREVEGK